MDRQFTPPLSEDEQFAIASEYLNGKLAKENDKRVKYAPQWVKLKSQHDGLIILDTSCDCMGEDHDLTVGVEWDEEWDEPAIQFWAELGCLYSTHDAWSAAFDRRKRAKNGVLPLSKLDDCIIWFTKWPGVVKIMWTRFKAASKLFLTGYGEWSGGTTFKGEKHIGDLMLALWWAQRQVEKSSREKMKKRWRERAKLRRLDMNKIAKGLGAERKGEMVAESGAFGATQLGLQFNDMKNTDARNNEEIDAAINQELELQGFQLGLQGFQVPLSPEDPLLEGIEKPQPDKES